MLNQGEWQTRSRKTGEQGYALLTLLLIMALLVIAAGVGASSLAFTIRRDREEELIHRGVQYTRAIREFTKRTGRFPVRLEELEQSEGRRFLRRRYKDPITGRDFKIVYMKDIQLGGSQFPKTSTSNPNNTSGSTPEAGSTTSPPDSTDNSQTDSNPTPKPTLTAANATAVPATSGGQPIVGGLIVGVVSASTDQTIREFNKKKHYNEWRFYYDTAFDRYFLVNAPTERSMVQPIAPIAGSSDQTTAPPSQPSATPPPAPQVQQ